MKPFLLLCVAAAVVAGCRGVERTVTAHVEIVSGTNRVTVRQPKDTTIDRLEYDPATGMVVLRGYASSGNAAAIAAARAQAEAQAAAVGSMVRAFELGAAAAAKSQGIPVSVADPPPVRSPAVPEGYKLVPKDDPSKPTMVPNPSVLPQDWILNLPFEGVLTNDLRVQDNLSVTNSQERIGGGL